VKKDVIAKDDLLMSLRRFKKSSGKKYSITRLGLFGSAARGDMHSLSDIDVVVELEDQDLFNIIGIKQDLKDQLHTSVDVVSYRKKMNEFLKQKIEHEAIYV